MLDEATLPTWVIHARRQVRSQISPPVLNLFSPDPELQRTAVYDCFASGRKDPRPLKALRASLRWLSDDVDVTWPAIQILSLMVGNPDMFWTQDNWIPSEITPAVASTFRWSSEEVALLMAAPAGDTWSRGQVGMGVFLVLKADPDCNRLLEDFVATTDDDELAWYGTLLRVYLAGEDGRSALDELVKRQPALRDDEAFADLANTLADHGFISLF